MRAPPVPYYRGAWLCTLPFDGAKHARELYLARVLLCIGQADVAQSSPAQLLRQPRTCMRLSAAERA
jgi:hypothetical protein